MLVYYAFTMYLDMGFGEGEREREREGDRGRGIWRGRGREIERERSLSLGRPAPRGRVESRGGRFAGQDAGAWEAGARGDGRAGRAAVFADRMIS